MRDDPKEYKFGQKFVLDLSKENSENEERAQIITEALNKHYGKIGGFELISSKNKIRPY
jgi:hypothetical protein